MGPGELVDVKFTELLKQLKGRQADEKVRFSRHLEGVVRIVQARSRSASCARTTWKRFCNNSGLLLTFAAPISIMLRMLLSVCVTHPLRMQLSCVACTCCCRSTLRL